MTTSKTLLQILAAGDPAATDASRDVRLLVSAAGDREAIGDRVHDVSSAVHRVETILALLQGGYRFDDARAAQYLKSFENACRTLRAEVPLLERIYAVPRG